MLEKLFLYLTFMPAEEIEAVMAEHRKVAMEADAEGRIIEARYAHKMLAKLITTMVHGEGAMKAISATTTYFDPALKHIKTWSLSQLESHFQNVKIQNFSKSEIDCISTLFSVAFDKSKNEVRRLIKAGGVTVNGDKVHQERTHKDSGIQDTDLLFGKYTLLKLGKKNV